MKLTSYLLLLATLSVCLASQVSISKSSNNNNDAKHVFVVLADSEIKQNSLISSLLSFGSAQILSGACSSQQLFGAADFKLGQINEVSRWSDKSRALYKFAVRHNHATRPELYIESRFTVQYLLTGASSAQRSSITFSDYNIKFDECATLQGSYKDVSSSHRSDTLIQQLLGHGNGYVCSEARNRNQLTRLPASVASLDVLAINKVSVRSLDDMTYYRYDVVLGDAGHKSYTVDATFIVMLCKKSGKYSIVSVEYNIRDLVDNKECGQSDYKSDTDCSDEFSDSSDSSDSDCQQSNTKKGNTKSRKNNSDDSDCSDNKRRSNSKSKDCSDDESDKCRTNSKSKDCSDDESDKCRTNSKNDYSDDQSDKYRNNSKNDCTGDQSDKRKASSKNDCSDDSSNKHSDKQSTRQINSNSNKSNNNTKRRSL